MVDRAAIESLCAALADLTTRVTGDETTGRQLFGELAQGSDRESAIRAMDLALAYANVAHRLVHMVATEADVDETDVLAELGRWVAELEGGQ